jgi:hypothetical protein
MDVPNLQTLDVRVERRIARATIDNKPIILMDASMMGDEPAAVTIVDPAPPHLPGSPT